MPIAVICPGCKTNFRVNEKFAGQKGPCPKCKTIVVIPQIEEVKIHAPEEFESGGKDSKGRPSAKPLTHSAPARVLPAPRPPSTSQVVQSPGGGS